MSSETLSLLALAEMVLTDSTRTRQQTEKYLELSARTRRETTDNRESSREAREQLQQMVMQSRLICAEAVRGFGDF
jgi:hypothetical protein